MKITRDTVGEAANRIVNDPEVEQGPINLHELVRDPRVFALVGEPPLGVHFCLQVIEGVYEFHSAVLPQGRGEWAVEFTRSAIEYMFVNSDCIELITAIPQSNLAALTLSRKFGFVSRWSCDKDYKGRIMAHKIVSLTLMEWLPAGLEEFAAVIEAIAAAGQRRKAAAWLARRRILSREYA